MGESVSFGRFMTESLAWEKWSTFSQNQNRYVEEAERFSKPGSVAQKKAFFEEHYKKLAAQKAAALLEQARIESLKEQEQHDEADSEKSKVVVNEENVAAVKEDKAFVGNSLQNQFEDVDNGDTNKDLIEKKGSNFGMEVLQSMDKSTCPIISDRDNISTPMNSKASLRKKRSKAKSLPMSVKFALSRQINRLNSILMKKFETTRVGSGSGSSIASKDIWTPLTTPTKACKNELQKHPSFSPLSENKRNIMKSPTISSQLSLRTEERTPRRNKERSHKKNRKLRLCFCFKPRPIPEFNKEREDSNRWTKEDSLTLTPGRRVTSKVRSKGSLSSESVITYENMSPNIQHGIKNERNN